MMIADFIANLTLDEQESKEVSNVTQVNYTPICLSPKWFLKEANSLDNSNGTRDDFNAFYRANFAYLQCDYVTALDEYMKVFEMENVKCVTTFAIADSIIRCSLKSAPVYYPEVLETLNVILLPLVSTYGEQLQYWELSLKVYLASEMFDSKNYLRNAILLCSSVECSNFWIMLSIAPIMMGRSKSNLHVGSLCRALYLLRREGAKKSVDEAFRDNQAKKIADIELTLSASYTPLEICEAEDKTCRPSHDALYSRKSGTKGIFKSKLMEQEMIYSFCRFNFSWLFNEINFDRLQADVVDVLKLF